MLSRVAVALALLSACGQVRAVDDADPDAAVDPDAAAPDAEPALACGRAFNRADLMGGGSMVTEGFEASNVAPGTFDQCMGPLSATTSGPCVNPGSVAPGFVLSDEFAEAAIYGDNFVPNAVGRWSGPGNPDRAIEIRFADPRARVGFDFITDVAGPVTVTTFDETNAMLDTNQVSSTAGSVLFSGVSCNKPGVSRVVINPSFGLVLVDQLSFGGE